MKKHKYDTAEFKIFTQIPHTGIPYKCPVCGGRGFVLSNFYRSVWTNEYSWDMGIETCRSCGGSGIVIC